MMLVAKVKHLPYWDYFIEMVDIVRNLVRADREGLWDLHLDSVQKAIPLFAIFDSTNYLRWCSIYLEDMRKLPETSPDIYQMFLAGKFVVKRSSQPFSAVAPDMCLEQTINRSSKSSSGIIGNTRRKEYVGQWNLIYHEMLAVANSFREISGVRTVHSELKVQHGFNPSETSAKEKMIDDMVTYIESFKNPFHVLQESEKKLCNILTQAIMPDDVRTDL